MTLNSGCKDDGKVELGNINSEKSEEVRRLISAELDVGASAESIEAFFEQNNIAYSYDRFAKRYQAIIRDVSTDLKVDQAVSIYVYVDDDKRFTSSEVRDTFTQP